MQMDVTIPDTITTWVMQAVAINNRTGLGLATPLRIVGKRDFFISLKMPYSVKRGEQVSLLATVFNYHEEEMRVSLKNKSVLLHQLLFHRIFLCCLLGQFALYVIICQLTSDTGHCECSSHASKLETGPALWLFAGFISVF